MYDVLLIGTGRMARAYAPVLVALKARTIAIGRSPAHARAFAEATGIEASAGGFDSYARTHAVPKHVIVAVDADKLASVAIAAIRAGARSVLLEKPGALTTRDLRAIQRASSMHGAGVVIAYNRRCYASVREAARRIKADGGATACYFEFNERLTQKKAIRDLGIGKKVEANWFIANSTHVVDLAFYLAGMPRDLESVSAAGPLWAPHPTLFAGSGVSVSGVPFAYRSNWELAGPWTVEITTKKCTYILNPLETLSIEKGGVREPVALDTVLDTTYKPGIFHQTKEFLSGKTVLPSLEEQLEHFRWYEQMLG